MKLECYAWAALEAKNLVADKISHAIWATIVG
jgi:hypothetical protein